MTLEIDLYPWGEDPRNSVKFAGNQLPAKSVELIANEGFLTVRLELYVAMGDQINVHTVPEGMKDSNL